MATPRKRTPLTVEPVVTIAGLQAVVAAGIKLATSFGLELTDTQQADMLAFYAVAAPLAFAVWARSKVSPTRRR